MGKATAKTLAIGNPADMGSSHIERHSDERGFLQNGDKMSETLLGNPLANVEQIYDDSMELAYSQGMLRENDWYEWNEKRALKRGRKNVHSNYGEYKESIGLMVSKRMGFKEKNVQKINKGMIFESGLYYLGSVEDYADKGLIDKDLNVLNADGLKEYRNFEGESLKAFYNSEAYQALHKGVDSRAEIHYDETGAVHLQTIGVMGTLKNTGGKVKSYEITPTKVKEERLREFLGSDVLEQELYRENVVQSHKMATEGFVVKREEYKGVNMQNFKQVPKKVNKGEIGRNQLIKQLWWRVHQDKMEDVALEKSKEMGVEWTRDYGDGVKRETLPVKEYAIHVRSEIERKQRNKELDEKTMQLESDFTLLENSSQSVKKQVKTKEHTLTQKERTLNEVENDLREREKVIDMRAYILEKERQELDEYKSDLLNQENRILAHKEAVEELLIDFNSKMNTAVQLFTNQNKRKPVKEDKPSLQRKMFELGQRHSNKAISDSKNKPTHDKGSNGYYLD